MVICNNKKCSLGECDQAETCSAYVPVVTNADRIRAMSDEELAEFLCALAFARETPWCDPFVERFCKSCPTIIVKIEETGEGKNFYECDFVDGECPNGSDVIWWLQQPADEEKA